MTPGVYFGDAKRLEKLERENKTLRELCEAQEDLLVCYRLGNAKRAGKAIDRIAEAKAKLEALERAADE